MKPVAVITTDIQSTFQWLKDNFDVDRIQASSRVGMNTSTGQKYILILDEKDVYGWEFCNVIVSPFYYSLEQIARSRVR